MPLEPVRTDTTTQARSTSPMAPRAPDFEAELAKVVIGQRRVIRLLTIAIFARGHVLLEGDVGVGKTTLLRAAARGLGGAYERIEGTIDLMPADMIYHTYIGEDGRPRVEPGPVIRYGSDLTVFFFNEINRARPQVHSLLLRLMAERSISAFNREYHFPVPPRLRRPQPHRARGDVRAAGRRARPLPDGDRDRDAGRPDDPQRRWPSIRASTTPTS